MSPGNKDLFEEESERGLFNEKVQRTSTSTTLIFNWTFAPPVQPFESNQLQSGVAWPILFIYHSFWANLKHRNNNNSDYITTWPRHKPRPCQIHNAWSEKKVIITDLSCQRPLVVDLINQIMQERPGAGHEPCPPADDVSAPVLQIRPWKRIDMYSAQGVIDMYSLN